MTPKPKRFYTRVTTENGQVLLDGKPLKTPKRAALILPTPALAAAVAAEWAGQGKFIDPATMPMTGLSNAAIDVVAANRDAVIVDCARYAETDLLCYRAEEPALAALQHEAWDPVLTWAQARYDVSFAVTSGVMPVAQPPATLSRMAEVLSALSDWQLAGMASLVPVCGSLLLALQLFECCKGDENTAVDAANMTGNAAKNTFEAAYLDDVHQSRQWGMDDEKEQKLAQKRQDITEVAEFLNFIKQPLNM